MECKELKKTYVFVWSGWSESAGVLLLFIEKDLISESEAKEMMSKYSVGIFAFASTVERGTLMSSTQTFVDLF